MAVAVYIPVAPLPPEFEPDLSFRVTTHDAFARHLQIGRDIVSTYGPWGLVQRGYDPRTDAAVLGVSALLAAIFVWGQRRNPAFAIIATLLLAFAGGDARFTIFPLLLILSTFEPPDLKRELPLVAAIAIVGQVKFSLLTFGLFVVIARRRLVHLATYAGVFLLAWIAAGQNPLNIPIFIARAAEVGRGYAAASALGTGVPLAILGGIGFVVLVAALERDILRTILVAAFVAYLFKVGFVREDLGHARPANAMLLLLIIGYGLARFPRLVFAPAAILAVVIGGPPFADAFFTNLRALLDRGAVTAELQRETYERSGAASVPRVAGTIDAFPWDSAALILRGARYAPRPVFQSCMTWTPKLAELNAQSLRSHAPDFIWASVGSIDDHLPMLDDSLAWREVVQRYAVESRLGEHLLLRRRSAPAAPDSRGRLSSTAAFGERVSVPDAQVVWCAIDVRPSIIREIVGRPPVLWLETETSSGKRQRWRVPYPMLRAGFILSPQITNATQLAKLIAREPQERVVAFRLLGDGFGDHFSLVLGE